MPTQHMPPFTPVSHTDWRAQVQKDLKNSDVHDSLRWLSPEGFTVDPYYTSEHLDAATVSTIQIGQKQATGWLNTPAYTTASGTEKEMNTRLRDALANGADALLLAVSGPVNLALLLNGIKLSDTPVFFRLTENILPFVTALRQLTPYQIRGGLLVGSESNLLAVNTLVADSPNFRTISVDAGTFHNAGATATQELAFTLAHLADTYDELTNTGLLMDELVPKTMISMAVGTSYFTEIAKLRALRVLWQRFIGHYSSSICHFPFLHVTTSPFYEAAATPYTNLLRATTEAMAAVIGGANALTVRPYDTVLGTTTEFSERIARNVSSLLTAESYLDKVADPSAGSYYIETLTHQLTEAAWAQFLAVEAMGGLAKATASGSLQQQLDEAYQAKRQAITNGKILVGVTKFRHDEAGTVGVAKPTTQGEDQSGKDGTVLIQRRLSESFE